MSQQGTINATDLSKSVPSCNTPRGLRVSQDAPGAGGERGAVQLRGVMGNFIRSHNYTQCWQLRGYAASTRP